MKDFKTKNYFSFLSSFLIVFLIVSFFILITALGIYPLHGLRKWPPYVVILIPIFILCLNFFKEKVVNKFFVIIAALFFVAFVVLGAVNQNVGFFSVISGLAIASFIAVIPKLRLLSVIFGATLIFLFSINSAVLVNNYHGINLIWTLCVVLIVIFSFLYSLKESNKSSTIFKINVFFLAILIAFSFFLAFRTDSFFVGTSESHWNFFTGPIETIRSGGELLWSAHSQYGFLNILIPSLFPWTTRNSLFIFQGILFFITTLMILWLTFSKFKNKVSFIPISLSFLSLFYFADPTLIGPAPFPSSSVVRFFCIYLLIYTIIQSFRSQTLHNGKINKTILFAYILGIFWSGESFFYTSLIFFTYLFCSSISMAKLRLKGFSVFKFLSSSILAIVFSFVGFNVIYLTITRHFPDWFMYIMFDFTYGRGFGDLPIIPWGVHWALIITLSALIFVSWKLFAQKKYQEWTIVSTCLIILWGLASYYVGRAAVSNITILLPLIFFIFIVTLLALKDSNLLPYRILLLSAFLPWIVIGVIGGIGNSQFISKVPTFRFFENVDSKSYKDKELNQLLYSLGASKGARIYYWSNNQLLSDGKGNYQDLKAPLPIPMILLALDPRLSYEKENALIIKRFLSKINEPGFFIFDKIGESDPLIIRLKAFLSKNYSTSENGPFYGKFMVLTIKKYNNN
jgi:hypothetical protein